MKTGAALAAGCTVSEEIEAQLGKLRGMALLQSFRGAPKRDVASLLAVVATLGRLMGSAPWIQDIEINSLDVGQGECALDALIISDPFAPETVRPTSGALQ